MIIVFQQHIFRTLSLTGQQRSGKRFRLILDCKLASNAIFLFYTLHHTQSYPSKDIPGGGEEGGHL